jgi:glycosyltransferase involved in cell wall biosynthesis
MKLLFVIKSLAVRGGGAERVLADLSAELTRRGYDVTVATFDQSDASPFYPFGAAVKLTRLGIGDAARRSRAGDVVRRVRALRLFLREMRPDVAVGFMHSAYVPLALAARGTGVPVIGSEHTVYGHYRTRVLDRIALRLVAGRLAAVTATSSSMIDGFPPGFRRGVRVIPNPVATSSMPRAQVEGGASKTLLAVGRLEPEKDHAILISAFATIAPRFPDWRLRIVGEGSLRKALQQQIDRLGLACRALLAGATSHVAEEYAAAQAFVMPSRYESFGLACAEALAAGLPAIGFADCPGTNAVIQENINGILVDGPDRVAALAEGLSQLMESAPLRQGLGAAGPASVAAFDLAAVASSWESLLQEVSRRCAA